jgi:hypothetical protein
MSKIDDPGTDKIISAVALMGMSNDELETVRGLAAAADYLCDPNL